MIGIRLITSAKPTVDAISVWIFLGEYRQNAVAILRAMRKRVVDPLLAAFRKTSSTGVASYQVQYTSFVPHSTVSMTPTRSQNSPNAQGLTPVSS